MFPEFFDSPLDVSLVGRARRDGVLDVDVIGLRQYGLGRHQKLDGAPFGGGPGLVMRIEPLESALTPLADSHKVLLSAGGQATPMTYEWDGRQFIVIYAGGNARAGTTLGDSVIAYALPDGVH